MMRVYHSLEFVGADVSEEVEVTLDSSVMCVLVCFVLLLLLFDFSLLFDVSTPSAVITWLLL